MRYIYLNYSVVCIFKWTIVIEIILRKKKLCKYDYCKNLYMESFNRGWLPQLKLLEFPDNYVLTRYMTIVP